MVGIVIHDCKLAGTVNVSCFFVSSPLGFFFLKLPDCGMGALLQYKFKLRHGRKINPSFTHAFSQRKRLQLGETNLPAVFSVRFPR